MYYYAMFLVVSVFASPVVAAPVVAAAASQHTVVKKSVASLVQPTVTKPVNAKTVAPSFAVPPTLAPPDANSTTAAAGSGTNESNSSVDQKVYTSGSMSQPGGIQTSTQPPMVQAMNSTVPPLLDTNSTTAPIVNKPSSLDKSIYTSGSMSHPGGKLTSTPPAFQPQTESAKRDALALKNAQDAQRRSAATKRASKYAFDVILTIWKTFLYLAHFNLYLFLAVLYLVSFPLYVYCGVKLQTTCAVAALLLLFNLIVYAVLQENADTKLQEVAYAIINGTILFAILGYMYKLGGDESCKLTNDGRKKYRPFGWPMHQFVYAVLVDLPVELLKWTTDFLQITEFAKNEKRNLWNIWYRMENSIPSY